MFPTSSQEELVALGSFFMSKAVKPGLEGLLGLLGALFVAEKLLQRGISLEGVAVLNLAELGAHASRLETEIGLIARM